MTRDELQADLRARIVAEGTARGAPALVAAQSIHLSGMVVRLADAMLGGERALAHVRAQWSLERFRSEAEGYLAAREWRLAVVGAVRSIAAEVAVSALQAGARSLLADLAWEDEQ